MPNELQRMSRTTINVPQEVHKDARDVKKEFDESWTEVLRFYADHRAELSLSDGVGDLEPFGGEVPEIDTDSVVDRIVHELEMGATPESEIESVVTDLEAEIKKAQELAEQARDNTEELKQGLGR